LIIAWIKCDVCRRRVNVAQHVIGGVTLNLCPYCSLALSSYSQQAGKARIEPDEEVIRRFSSKSKSRKGV
jgi:hypothetical protein